MKALNDIRHKWHLDYVIILLFTRLISDLNWKLVNDFHNDIKHVNLIVVKAHLHNRFM